MRAISPRRSATIQEPKGIGERRRILAELRSGEPHGIARPRTRADCIDGPRPCPWVSCREHLYLSVRESNGSLTLHYPDVRPDEMELLPATCALDLVAERGAMTLDEVSTILGVTRERVRQLEMRAIRKLKHASPAVYRQLADERTEAA